MKNEDGRSGAEAPSGCQPSASAAVPASSQSGIPNAGEFESYVRTGSPDSGEFDGCPVPTSLDARIDVLWECGLWECGEPLSSEILPKELYANPAASQAMLDDPAFDVMEWLAQEIAREFAMTGAAEFRGQPTKVLRDPFTNKPFVHFYATRSAPAQVIEARRAATGTGAVEDESAVPKGCAQTFSPEALEYLAQQHEDEQAELIASGHPDIPKTVSTAKALRAIEAAMTGGRETEPRSGR